MRPIERTTDHMEHAKGFIGQTTSRIERITDPMKRATDSMDLPKGPMECNSKVPVTTQLVTSGTCKHTVLALQACATVLGKQQSEHIVLQTELRILWNKHAVL